MSCSRVLHRAVRYLQGLSTRQVAPDEKALAGLAEFDEPLPEGPDDPRHVLELLDRVGSPATMASAGPRFFGFVIGGAHPVAVAADWLATAWDQNAGSSVASPVTATLERVTALAQRVVRTARHYGGRFRDGRDDGQHERARGGASRGARTRRL